jgi:2-phosphosulfolactate phosphatase
VSNPGDFAYAAALARGFNSRVHVLLRKEDLDSMRLPGKVVIVLDVLFATTTIVSALANGASEVIPALDERDARLKAGSLADGTYLLAGEKNIDPIDGFASPLPLALAEHDLRGKRLIYSTTNGTVALRLASAAAHVYAACLLNGAAVARHVIARHPNETVVVVCSGSAGGMNLEDLYGAGYLVDQLAAGYDEARDFSDAALAARKLYQGHDPFDCLIASRIGRIMRGSGFEHEVRYAARRGELAMVPKLDGDIVRSG